MVAAVAYRLGTVLHDERYGVAHNYTRKRASAHMEILAPPGAPAWVHDRQMLWNRVESAECRKDSQLARAIEIGLPVELSREQCVALLRDYIDREFVSKGMIADFGIRGTDSSYPHAHILLTLREPTTSGFGPKARQWNRKSNLLEWRAAWAERANQHLARAGHAVRIDHRTLDAQQIEFTPERRIGVGPRAANDRALPRHLRERIEAQQQIAKNNGQATLEDPTLALRALVRHRQSFTRQDIADFLRSRTENPAQFAAALLAVMQSSELVALDSNEGISARLTTRNMLDAEKSLLRRATAMSTRRGHGVVLRAPALEYSPSELTEAQRCALEYATGEGDIKVLMIISGSDKSAVLAPARKMWESRTFNVLGTALSKIAVEDLVNSSGIKSRALESVEREWNDSFQLTSNDVWVVDGAEMIALKALERILAVADQARAKVVLVGDSRQLEPMGSLSPLHGVIAAIPFKSF